MDQKAFISDIDTALADLIRNNIENDSTTKNIISSQEQISFSSPKDTGNRENRKLSIFLYNISKEKVTDNTHALALHYLVTPLTGNAKDDHALLEKIIQISKRPIGLDDSEKNKAVVVNVDFFSLDELSRLWIALGSPLRLSVGLTIFCSEAFCGSKAQGNSSSVALKTPAITTEHVIQLYQVVLRTFTEQSAGWMNRNMVIKQWVLQEFKKNTGMTVEEMLIALNHLGDKLEQNQHAVQFTETLNHLAGYYQHQVDELRGFQKLTHKQTENLEAITVWIEDIKALVEALVS